METIEEKYKRIRPNITDGCLLLMSKNAWLSKTIRKNDRNEDGTPAEFSHIGLIFEKAGTLFIVDSNSCGVKPAVLSDRISECDNFIVIKPLCSKEIIEKQLENSFFRLKTKIYYDFEAVAKIWFNNHFGTDFKIRKRDKHDICSDWTRDQSIGQNMVLPKFETIEEPSPQDYIRYRNTYHTTILK